MEFLRKHRFIISIIFVYILSFSLRIYFAHMKIGFFPDETCSYSVTTPTNKLDGKIFKIDWMHFKYESGKIYEAKELKKSMYKTDNTLKSALRDIKHLYFDNGDHSHTNLYYTMFRLWNIGLDDISFDGLKWRGVYFNLIFFTLSFFIMYKLLQLIVDKKYIPLGLFFAFLSSGSISTTIYVRMYQVHETMMLLFTYWVVKSIIEIRDGRKDFNYKWVLLTALITALCTLSGYYALIYEAILAFVIFYYCIRYANLRLFTKFVATFALSILFCWCLYQGFFNVFTTEYTVKTFEGITVRIYTPIRLFLFYLDNIFDYIYYKAFLVPVLFLLLAKNRVLKKEPLIFILVGCSLVWTGIIFLITPIKLIRYLLPVYPLLGLLYLYVAKYLSKTFVVIMCSVYFLFAAFAVSSDIEIKYFREQNKGIPKIFYMAKMMYLFRVYPQEKIPNSLPYMDVYEGEDFKDFPSFMYFIDENQKVRIYDNIKDLKREYKGGIVISPVTEIKNRKEYGLKPVKCKFINVACYEPY